MIKSSEYIVLFNSTEFDTSLFDHRIYNFTVLAKVKIVLHDGVCSNKHRCMEI